MQDTNTFSGIRKAALCIAYDNGHISCERSESEFLEDVDCILGGDGVCYDDLDLIDKFLLSLSDEQMNHLCCGEQEEEMRPVLEMFSGDHEMLNGLLEDIFNL